MSVQEMVRNPAANDEHRTRAMSATLERGLSRHFGKPVRIRELQSEFHLHGGSQGTERLRVWLEDGRRLPVFFKDLGPRSPLQAARRMHAPHLGSSRVELRMYRGVLSPERYGTPRLYASLWQPRRGLCWLFLEDLGELELHQTARFDLWLSAARWAARLHAAARDLPPAKLRVLPHRGHDHYRGCAEEIERRASVLDFEELQLVLRALDLYRTIAPRLTELPQSLIHGRFFGHNILLRRTPPQRITVVDWESAAVGPSYLDAVSLSSGERATPRKLALRRAYFDQYQMASGRQLRWESFCRDLEDLDLYQALLYLAPAMRTSTVPSVVARRRHWVQQLERLLQERARRDS